MKKYIVKNLKWLNLFVIMVLLSNLAAVVVQFVKGAVLNLALEQNNKKFLICVLALLGSIAVEILLTYLSFRFENSFKINTMKALKKDFFHATLRMKYPDFQAEGNENVLAKYNVVLPEIQNRYMGALTLLFGFIVKIITITVALITLDWRLAIITLVLLSMPIYIPKIFEKKLQEYQKKFMDSSNELTAFLTNILEGFEVIKNFSVEKKFLNLFIKKNDDTSAASLKNENYGAFMKILMACMSYFSYFVIIAFSGYLVYKGEFDAGQFFIAVGMIDQLSYPIIGISGCIQSVVAMKPMIKETTEFMLSNSGEESYVDGFSKGIKCNNVSFKYEDEDEYILKNVDFEIKKNGKYLIVGENGSGKTTFVNCLLKYHEVNNGEILYDDVNISKVDSVFNVCSVLRQNVFLFADNLRNNITLFNNTISDKEIIDVLKKLKLDKYANAEGLDMLVGSGGVVLSGGEQRKIGLARTLLANKNILILDEPLANLDQDSKDVIMNSIINIKDKTLIMISHEWLERAKGSENQFDGVLRIKNMSVSGNAYA